MGAMLVYVEDVRRKIAEMEENQPPAADQKSPEEKAKVGKSSKPVRVLPANLAMGWIYNQIESGKFPDAKPGDFYPLLFRDTINPNPNGAYLVDLLWYAAFYRESPEGKVLPVQTTLTSAQATAMQRLAWDIVENYPDCGVYKEGQTPAGAPEFSPASGQLKEITRVTLSSSTPGAWFRYTLDGTEPSHKNGYVYCGVISVRPGMTVRAVTYKNGLADSPVVDAVYPRVRGAGATPAPR